MQQHFKIVALNELNEPFNSNNIYNTPKYVNTNEYVNFFYSSTTGLTLKGNEKWVWDFDFNTPTNLKDNPIQEFLGFNKSLPILFTRGGDRKVNVKVYDRIPKKSVKLQSNNEFSVLSKPVDSIYNPLTNHLLVINETSNKLTIVDVTNDNIVKTLNLSASPKKIAFSPVYGKFYITLNNNTIDVISANNETVSANIPLGVLGNIEDILYVDSIDYFYIIVNNSPNSNIVIIDASNNNIINTISVLSDSHSLNYLNNFLWFVNSSNNTISKMNISSNLVSTIATNINPQKLIVDIDRNLIYIRCLNHINICNQNVVINSIIVDTLIDSSDLVLNNSLEEIYIVGGTNSNIQTIDINSYELLPKTIQIFGIKGLFYDEYTNSIYVNKNNISEKRTIVLDASDFSQHTYFKTFGDTILYYRIPNGKIYALQTNSNKVSSFVLYPSNTNQSVDGKLLYQDTIHFFIFEFPTNIIGLEYAVEGQTLNYYTNSGSNSAQTYEWFINGEKQLSNINSLTFNFTNYVKVLIKVNVKNGRITKTLNFTTSLSVGSAVVGQKYEGNVLEDLMFFNKEGDNLNLTLVENEYGDMQWEGDLIFHPNSDDTFKTIGLYILESVKPLDFSSEDLKLRKLQLFNEEGFDIEGGSNNAESFLIDDVDIVNKQDGFYTKWIYSNEIDKKIPIGSEILLKNIYNVNINNTIPENPILTSYNIIEDFNSYSTSGGVDLFTVVGNKRGAIMVITKTLNKNFNSNYAYGDFRLQSNNIQKIPQGEIIVLNLFKVYNPNNLNLEWNEPFYKSLLYDKKKISLVNTQKNDGVFTVNYIDDNISNDINSKYLKIRGIDIKDLLNDVSLDFRIKLDFKTNKIFLGNSPVDFLPASTDPFLNEKSLLVWDSVLDKDYTPKLIKDGLHFSFEQVNPALTNFDKIYTAIKVDIASNILTPQTSDTQGWKIVLKDYDSLKDFSFNFTINNKSTYHAIEGINWKRGNSLNDAAASLAFYLESKNNKVVGLSVIAINNEIWIWEKKGYSFVLNNTEKDIFSIDKGILKMNNPEYGVVGDEWVILNDVSLNGYVHYRESQSNFHILYITNSGNNWYTLPLNKKVIWTEQIDKINPNSPNSEIIEYGENFITDAYLEDTTIYFTQKGDSTPETTSRMVVERFVKENQTLFMGYGLDLLVEEDNKLNIINNYTTKTLNSYDDYVEITFETDLGTQGSAGSSKFIASTSSYVLSQYVDMINVLEDVSAEKNRKNGNYIKEDSLSKIWSRKLIIKDIDQKTGFTLNINGIDYQVPYNNVSVSGLDSLEDTIIDVEATLEDWGNQKFKLSQDINDSVDDSDIGKPYYEVLELQGVLVWLEKSEESYVNGVKHFDTIVLQSKYPNVNISYSINGTLDNHKVLHSDVEFKEIGSELSITINRVEYLVGKSGGVETTLNNWVEEWKDTLLLQDVVVNYLDATYDTSGSSAILLSYPKIRFSTLEERTNLKYDIWIGKSPILGNPAYFIKNYKNGNQGIILSGNEIRINNINFEEVGFATAMITSLKNSKFPLNNQEYNLLFVDPNILGLSYQGAFWNNSDVLNYYIKRSGGFNWEDYKQIFLLENNSNSYFSTSGISQLTDLNNAVYMEYEAFNDYMWISHNNGLNGTITIYDVADFSTKGVVQVANNPTYMKWNPLDNNMYISNKGSNKISVIDTDTFNTIQEIPTGISPTQMIIDNYTNYLYVINEDNDDVNVIDLSNYSLYATIPVGDKPVKMSLDRSNRLLYVVCQNNNRVYIIDTIQNSLKSYINVGSSPSDIIWNDKNNKVYVSNTLSNSVNIITYNKISDSFSIKTLNTNSNPNSLQYNKDLNNVYVACSNKIQIIDANLDIIMNTVNIPSVIGMIKYIPFANSLFYTSPTTNQVGLFKITDPFYNLTILPVGNSPVYITSSTNNIVFVSNELSNFTSLLKEVYLDNSSSGTSGETILSLSTREFLRYPRERFEGEEPIYFKVSWEEEEIVDDSMFFYDFSGKQLYIEMKNEKNEYKRINDNGVYNYIGETPLIFDVDKSFLNKIPNKDKKEITNPKVQQTIFDSLYFDLDLIDSEEDLDPRPTPMQIFVGYNSKKEGVNQRTLKIERLENISLTIDTRPKDENNLSLGYIDILDFNEDNNEVTIKNSKINFIESGFKKGQIVEFSGYDSINIKNQAVMKNSGFLGKIEKVLVNRIVFIPINKEMKTESSYTQTYSMIPPFRAKDATFKINMVVKPCVISKIKLRGQTEIEDERFKVLLNNMGYNINHRDVYIFKEYDIKESGIDWIFLNQKRKEMLVNYPEIYNYLGSYKALINAINYFGYNDLELYEYYLNINKDSEQFGKYSKIEISDIFNTSVDGYTPNDFVLKNLPNKNYQKTKLFNLTYRITDEEGNYILGYSLEEIINKLLGLKKWLRENVMPIGTRISDLTGRGDTPATTTLWHDVKQTVKFSINEDLTPVNFKVEAYLQPVENYSKTYNVHIDFFTQDSTIPDYYHVNIYTFSIKPDLNDPNFKLRCVQNLSYYKTDMLPINIAADRYTDPFIYIESISDSGYSSTYMVKKVFSLEIQAYI